jgi:BirA family transcriptional regulator, biotin operon repressor / biotin---[acetyl-CoA-carboxylase] ligase
MEEMRHLRHIPNLDRDSILRNLRTKQLGRPLEILDGCTSTNDVAAQQADAGAPHGYTILAEEQTAGRGRQGRTWVSPRGGIWLTTLLRPPLTLDPLNALPIIAALAAARAINSSLGINARVRWPNDVFVGGRKLAGVLAETKFKGNQVEYALLGVGINANFPATALGGLSTRVTSLRDLVGLLVDREALIALLLIELENVYEMASSNPDRALALLQELDYSRGRQVRIKLQAEEISGTMAGYESLTSVRIRTADGLYRQVETGSVVGVEYAGF